MAIAAGQLPWRAGWHDGQGEWTEVAGHAPAGVGAWLLAQLEAAAALVPEALAVESGPGSFAALRSSLALALGLGRGWGCPVWPVSTFEILAASVTEAECESVGVLVPGPPPLIAVQRQRPGIPTSALSAAAWVDRAALGSALAGVEAVCGPRRERWLEWVPAGVRALDPSHDEVRTTVLAACAERRWRGAPPPSTVEPLYLRPAVGLPAGAPPPNL